MATIKPNLVRIWADDALIDDVQDPDDIEPGKFEAGWDAEIPPFEYFNFLQQLFTQGLAHFNEQGIGIWDAATTYPVGGVCKGSEGWLYECVQENSGVDPTLDDETFWIIYYKGYEDLQGSAFPSGTRMVFYQAQAPVNWTQVVLGADALVRVVPGSDGGEAGGTDSPILNGKVPSHTHTTNNTGSHNHTVFADVTGGTGTSKRVLRNNSGAGNNNTSNSGNHTHVIYANEGASDWRPRYVNCILGSKD